MNQTETRVSSLKEAVGRVQGFQSAISLHSHTHYSKENLRLLPHYATRLPVVGRLVQLRLKDYEERHGRPLDFKRAYWTPPASPCDVLASETSQIEESLGLAALVSITDHDSIEAGLFLQQQRAAALIPISVEWTIPFAGNTFHVGVHCLPPDRATEIMRELAQYTAEPREEMLAELFILLERSPETLLILNHPCWDFMKVGSAKHDASLQEFMARWRQHLHALEVNGMRSWLENQEVVNMAEAYELPAVAGGDRHGLRPNTLLNLSPAKTWGDFAGEIRECRRSEILVMPSYEEPVPLRDLATLADALRYYPDYPNCRRRFTDRVFADTEGCGPQPLSFYWAEDEARQPPWLQAVASLTVALGSDSVRPVLRRLLSLSGNNHASWKPKVEPRGEALVANTDAMR